MKKPLEWRAIGYSCSGSAVGRSVSSLARGPVIGQTGAGMEEAAGSIPARSANPIHQFPVMNGRNKRSVELAGFLRGQRPQLRKAWIVD